MKTARHLHGQPIPDGWHRPIGKEYAYSSAGRVRISLNPQKGWVLEREEASGTFLPVPWTWVPLYYGASLGACAAWWAIEKSNEPGPVAPGFDYANNPQLQAYAQLTGGKITVAWGKP